MVDEQAKDEPKEIPLHARLFWYQLEPLELLALKGMVEHCWDGSCIWMSIPRLAAYTKISEKQLQRIIGGYDERRKDEVSGTWNVVQHHRGLVERGILTQLAKEKPAKRRPATYRLNEAALSLDPKMRGYISEERQGILPGVDRRPVPGEKVRPRQKTFPGMHRAERPRQRELQIPPDTVSPVARGTLPTQCRQSPDTVSPDSLHESLRTCVYGSNGFSGLKSNQKENIPTTTETFPVELQKGLREFVPEMDAAAIKRIWQIFRQAVPDCGVGEILYFAGMKAQSLHVAKNPTGFLISTLALHATEDSILDARRQLAWEEKREQERQRQAEKNAQDQQAWEAGAPERERQRVEAERAQEDQRAAELQKRAEQEQRRLQVERDAAVAFERMTPRELEELRAEAIKQPEMADYLQSIRKLIEHGMATEATAEPRIKQAMKDLLMRRIEATA